MGQTCHVRSPGGPHHRLVVGVRPHNSPPCVGNSQVDMGTDTVAASSAASGTSPPELSGQKLFAKVAGAVAGAQCGRSGTAASPWGVRTIPTHRSVVRAGAATPQRPLPDAGCVHALLCGRRGSCGPVNNGNKPGEAIRSGSLQHPEAVLELLGRVSVSAIDAGRVRAAASGLCYVQRPTSCSYAAAAGDGTPPSGSSGEAGCSWKQLLAWPLSPGEVWVMYVTWLMMASLFVVDGCRRGCRAAQPCQRDAYKPLK